MLTNIIAIFFVRTCGPRPTDGARRSAGRYGIVRFAAAVLFIFNCLCAKFELYSHEFILGCDAVKGRQFGT